MTFFLVRKIKVSVIKMIFLSLLFSFVYHSIPVISVISRRSICFAKENCLSFILSNILWFLNFFLILRLDLGHILLNIEVAKKINKINNE